MSAAGWVRTALALYLVGLGFAFGCAVRTTQWRAARTAPAIVTPMKPFI
jgi:hypothetical protein